MLLSDKTITGLAYGGVYFQKESICDVTKIMRVFKTTDQVEMIAPFVSESINKVNGHKCPSYGLSSFGYDVRLGDEIKLFVNHHGTIIDPLNLDEDNFIDVSIKVDEQDRRFVILPPNSYLLGHTLETINMPNDVTALVTGKSTYARLGMIVNTTVIEAGFSGQVVLEIMNAAPSALKIYLDGGIAQFLFIAGNEPCDISYADRGGKYQHQTGVQHAKC